MGVEEVIVIYWCKLRFFYLSISSLFVILLSKSSTILLTIINLSFKVITLLFEPIYGLTNFGWFSILKNSLYKFFSLLVYIIHII